MEHFYGRAAGEMTLPEFIGALENIGRVREELKPRTAEEIHARAIAETARQQEAALKAKLETRARTGGG